MAEDTVENIHPIVDETIDCLTSESSNGSPPLFFVEGAHEHISERLNALSVNPTEFREAVRDLLNLSHFLYEEKQSPQAADELLVLVAENPLVVQYASEVAQENVSEEREKVGDKFAKFTNTASANEAKIETSEPSVSARDLMRHRPMSG
jgi:hypothetical protein